MRPRGEHAPPGIVPLPAGLLAPVLGPDVVAEALRRLLTGTAGDIRD